MLQKIDNQKKRKKIVEKNKDTILSKPKKRKTQSAINMCDKNKKKVNSYSNCLYGYLKLEDCVIKNCTNKLHYSCQNNIDNVSFDSQFEEKYGKAVAMNLVKRRLHITSKLKETTVPVIMNYT